MSPVTLSDIANELHLSVSTVSYALRGTGSVSAKTRERVRAVAERMGYRPDPLISATAARRFARRPTDHSLVAFLQNKPGGGRSIVFQQLEQASAAYGLQLTEHLVPDPDRQLAPLLRQLYQRGYSGLILGRTLEHGQLDDEAWSRFSVLRLAAYSDVSRFHRIAQSDPLNLRRLIEKAREKGYRRPGLVIHAQYASYSHDDLLRVGLVRFEGSALGVYGPPGLNEKALPCPLVLDNETGRHWENIIPDWVKSHAPDCVLATHTGVYPDLKEMAYPGGFAAEILTGIEQYRAFSGFGPELGSLNREILQRMDSLIRHRETGVPRFSVAQVVPSEWQDGGTL